MSSKKGNTDKTEEVKYNWFSDTINKSGIKQINVGGKFLQYMIAVCVVIYLIFMLYTISNDKNALDENYILYMVIVIVPLALMFLAAVASAKSNSVFMIAIACAISLFAFFLTTVFPDVGSFFNTIYQSMFDYTTVTGLSEEESFLVTLIMKFIIIGIIVIGLSLFYNLFMNQAYRQEGFYGFITYLIFYIPCLLSDFIAYVFKEFKATPNIVLVLFVLEILFIIAYFAIPARLLGRVISKGNVIQRDPLFLMGHKVEKPMDALYKDDEELEKLIDSHRHTLSEEQIKKFNKNYCISLWLSYNPSPVHKDYAEEVPLFYIGDSDISDKDYNGIRTGIPYLAYLHSDEFVIRYTNNMPTDQAKQKELTTEIHLPGQRWNNIVFNYHNSRVDLFINGSLERTILFKTENMDATESFLPSYQATDSFHLGSLQNNVHSAICNLVVFSEPLTESEITQQYNLLKMQNPPVNNLL